MNVTYYFSSLGLVHQYCGTLHTDSYILVELDERPGLRLVATIVRIGDPMLDTPDVRRAFEVSADQEAAARICLEEARTRTDYARAVEVEGWLRGTATKEGKS